MNITVTLLLLVTSTSWNAYVKVIGYIKTIWRVPS